jgi:hypothetical protein
MSNSDDPTLPSLQKAMEALKTCQPTPGGRVPEPESLAYIRLFLDALDASVPEGASRQFAARDIKQWAEKLSEVSAGAFTVPPDLLNPYRVASVLRLYAAELGLATVGTYGNRTFYERQEKPDHD